MTDYKVDELVKTALEAAHDKEMFSILKEDKGPGDALNSIIKTLMRTRRKEYLAMMDKAHQDAVYVLNHRALANRLEELGYTSVQSRAPMLEALKSLEEEPVKYQMAYEFLRMQIAKWDIRPNEFLKYVESIKYPKVYYK